MAKPAAGEGLQGLFGAYASDDDLASGSEGESWLCMPAQQVLSDHHMVVLFRSLLGCADAVSAPESSWHAQRQIRQLEKVMVWCL